MNLQLQSRVILVTGIAGSIGDAMVETLTAEQAIPCVLCQDKEDGLQLAKQWHLRRPEVHFFPLELSDPEACEYAVHRIAARLGRIDGMVHYAGFHDHVGLEHGDHYRFLHSLQNDIGHCYSISRAGLPALKRSGGSIVHIISKNAYNGHSYMSGHAATHSARSGLVTVLADELKPYNIRVNGILVAGNQTPQGRRHTIPEEVANMAGFLLSPVSAAINRQTIFVDGDHMQHNRPVR